MVVGAVGAADTMAEVGALAGAVGVDGVAAVDVYVVEEAVAAAAAVAVGVAFAVLDVLRLVVYPALAVFGGGCWQG